MNKRPAIALVAVLAVLALATFGGGFRLIDDVISMQCLERSREGRAVALGDSITLGKGDPAWNFQGDESWFSYATCDGGGRSASVGSRYGWNAGKNGNTTAQMLARFTRDVAARHPRRVVLLGGTNDVFQGVPVDVTTLRLADLISRAKRLPAEVLIGTIPPFNDPGLRGAGMALNDRIRQLAAAEQIGLVDFYAAVALSGSYRPGWTDDGIHPTPTAARAMGEAYRRVTARS